MAYLLAFEWPQILRELSSKILHRKCVIPEMVDFEAGSKHISVFPGCKPDAPVIYLNTFSGEGQAVWKAAQILGCPPFTLVAISNLDWNHDMTPWNSPPAFKNGEPCTGGADDYLRILTEEIVPAVEKKILAAPRWRGIAGYSLAGLFALYAMYQTDMFSRVGSMSGSLWFPGMKEYIVTHKPKRRPDCLYLSLGNKESKTRNPILKTVQQNTEEIAAFYKAGGIETAFQLNEGNHFDHAAERTAKGICWLLNR